MPSPFPGMDPYVEDQKLWRDFHSRFVPYCCDYLSDLLPDPYEARLEEEFRLVQADDDKTVDVRPDVVVEGSQPAGWVGRAALAGALTLEPLVFTLPAIWTEVRDVWIEIRRRPDRRLVTVIEILSPTNKASGSGVFQYLAKRSEFVRESIHIVEIDLLLEGRRLPMAEPLPPLDYFTIVSRAERRPRSDVFAWTIRQGLPLVPIPLLPPDSDVPLDLAGVFGLAYDRGKYAKALDYRRPLSVPLAPADKAWAEGVASRGAAG